MSAHVNLVSAARSIASLAPAVSGLDQLSEELADTKRAGERGYFTPDEDERVRARFAQYLTARAGLLQTIQELKPLALSNADGDNGAIDEPTRLRAFTIAFTAAALLVRAGRFIVDEYAPSPIVQRKLNEAEPRYGIPRKQYTAVYQSLTDPRNAWRLHEALQFAEAHRSEIEALADDPDMAVVLQHLQQAKDALNVSARRYVMARIRYRWHSLRRRRASALQQAMFGLMEAGGRIVAEIHNPFHTHRISRERREQITALLKPGDVLVSRHDDAMSNLFLPGYWVHAALHIGPETARRELAIKVDQDRAARWIHPIRTLEAKKDGVRFRALEETLAVDSVAILRPKLEATQIGAALSQAVTHEGKLYDFEFDFFRSDKLVCTEVVYRAYHGIGSMEFQLSRRAGRPTLAAEDLIDMVLAGRGFEPVAVFGPGGADDEVVVGPQARDVLVKCRKASEHA